MKSVIIEAKTGSEENGNLKEFTSEVEMPEDIEEAISQYGSDEVWCYYCSTTR